MYVVGVHIWFSPVLSIEGDRRGFDFGFLTPEFFIFTRKGSKDEAVDVNSCPR